MCVNEPLAFYRFVRAFDSKWYHHMVLGEALPPRTRGAAHAQAPTSEAFSTDGQTYTTLFYIVFPPKRLRL